MHVVDHINMKLSEKLPPHIWIVYSNNLDYRDCTKYKIVKQEKLNIENKVAK